MSGQLRSLKKRIRSIESTKKITRAMEMVSAAKLKRFQALLKQASPYAEALTALIGRLIGAGATLHHPLLAEREEKSAALLVITSDAGLCGSYNTDLIHETRRFIKSKEMPPLLVGFGKNGVSSLSRFGCEWEKAFVDTKAPDLEHTIKKIEIFLEAIFRERKVDAVYVVRTAAVTGSSYKAVTERVLPFRIAREAGEPAEGPDYIFEPNAESLFTRILPLVFEAKVREIFYESFVAEQALRMNAMHQATENATELIDALVLLRNKIRQAAITTELTEIVSGSRALKQ